MTDLKKNIDHYMDLKGIKMYSHLLVRIANELGIKGQEAYEFADKEKANFSKTLKGDRPLKYDFVIPLEKIFGVSLAKLLYEDEYKLPVEKDNVPFDKGFRYYAYLDDMDLYKSGFDKVVDNEGKSIMCNSDEFGKTFLDYVVEYGSKNAVRYLYDEYGIKLRWYHNHFDFTKSKGITWIHFDKSVEFARLVASINDTNLFYDIYDSYNMFFSNGHYASDICIYNQGDFFEIIMDNDNLFKNLFEIKKYDDFYCANPILNNCLRYSLTHIKKYKKQAIEILNFGIKHNERVFSENNIKNCCNPNELGGLYEYTDDRKFVDLIIFVDVEVDDEEVKKLINELPKFENWR